MKTTLLKKDQKLTFRQYLLPADTPELSKLTSSRKNNQLIPHSVLEAIGDKCMGVPHRSILKAIAQFYQRFDFIIRPDNIAFLCWSCLIMMIVIYYILQIGLLIGFGNAFWSDQLSVLLGLQIVFILILSVDILIAPLRAYYSQGILIDDIGQILRRYCRLQFWIDILGIVIIVIPLIVGSLSSNSIKILWFLKLFTASRINDDFQRATQLYITLNTIYLIIKLIAFCYFYAHFMGIGFYMVSLWVYNTNYYGPNTPNICWVYTSWAYTQMVFLPWSEMYVYIMYYSIAVVTTIAYGDITPKNPIQCLYTIAALIIVTIIFGYLLTQILRLLINVFSYNFERRFNHFELNNKLRELFVSQETQTQIRAHTEEIDRDEQYRNRKIQDNILHFLPDDPLYGLLLVIYRQFLIAIGFTFTQQLSHSSLGPAYCKSLFLQQFMKSIRQERHFIGDVFYKEGDLFDDKVNHHSVYFYTKQSYADSVLLGIGKVAVLRGGKLDIQKNCQIKSYQLSKARSVFGNIQFLTGGIRSHWAICLANCVLFVINRSSFLNHYSALTLQEKQIVFYKMENVGRDACFVCGKKHFFKECNYVFVQRQDAEQSNKKVRRVAKLRIMQRNRLKTLSSWIVYNNIKNMKVTIPKDYRHKLMYDKVNQGMFVEYELDEQEQDFEYDLQFQLKETQIIIEKIYSQQIEALGLPTNQQDYDHVYQFSHYKTKGNFLEVSKDYGVHSKLMNSKLK